jgi:hypothetical protein
MSDSPETSGAEFKKFYNDPEMIGDVKGDVSWYIDDLFIRVNGKDDDMDAVFDAYGDNFEQLPDEAIITLETGYFCWQGKGAEPVRPGGETLIDAFLAWKKAQSTLTVAATFDLPKDGSLATNQRLLAVLNALGAKVTVPKEWAGQSLPIDQVAAVNTAVQALLEDAPAAPRRRPTMS